jgi:ABC-type transport system involved in multi-copper enzyme maturation permease subunit
MWTRWELGPVFALETTLNARRRQVYEVRSFFVLIVLIGLIVVWFNHENTNLGSGGRASTLQQMAKLGELFFYTLAGIQISLVMLVAPAATVGSICIDRAWGTLVHMLMTDLSDSEIVLGKLGARLAPVIGIITCGVPVVAIIALLGGIEFNAIAGLFGVSLALAVLGCSLAIAISVWATKTHDVLIALYIIEGLWLLALPLWNGWASSGSVMPPPDWFQKANPYVLILSPLYKPGFVGVTDYLIFIAAAFILSAGLAVLSVVKLRCVVIDQSGRPRKPGLRLPRLNRLFPSWAGPSLDGNPVLWREWHRNQPSRLARVMWVTILLLGWILAAWGTYGLIKNAYRRGHGPLSLGMMLQLFFGMLIIAATAPTVLAEGRVRGCLDVLFSTPLSTRSIVLGKWLGACHSALVLSLLPLYAAIFLASSAPAVPSWVSRFPQTHVEPLTIWDRMLSVLFCGLDFFASCALLVSVGLAIATWVPRLGRAVVLSVLVFFLTGIGWLLLFALLFRAMQSLPGDTYLWLQTWATSLSPISGPATPIFVLERHLQQSRVPIWIGVGVVILAKTAVTGSLLWLTIKTFDRCMGRISESRVPRGIGEPTAPVELVPTVT